jgi:hypothetical protein
MKRRWSWIFVVCFAAELGCSAGDATTTAAPQPPAKPAPTSPHTTAAAKHNDLSRAASNEAAHPVRWWSGLELKTLEDAGKLYTTAQADSFGDLQRGESTKRPSDCVEWTRLHVDGYEPTSTVEAQADNGATLRCMTLLLLQRAQPAKVSFVRDLAWDQSLLQVLPAAVATAFNEKREQEVSEATSKGQSLAQFDRKAKVNPSPEEHTAEIIEGDGQKMIVVHAEAWGDFNGDGVDDVALSVVNGATKGTYSYVRLLTLSRGTSGATLTPVAVK